MIDTTWYKKPHTPIQERITAGGIVVRKKEGVTYVALILEGRATQFALPKGGVKKGETLEQAARREIHEEAGIQELTLIEYLGKRERFNFNKTRWTIIHFYLFTTEQEDCLPTDTTKKHFLQWFPITDLPYMLWPEQKRIIQDTKRKIQSLI